MKQFLHLVKKKETLQILSKKIEPFSASCQTKLKRFSHFHKKIETIFAFVREK